MPLAAGVRLGPYEILAPVGSGGMGEVYKARDTRLERLVAIKVLPAGELADQGRRDRFVQEARAASALNHPNIVTIYDVGTDNGVDYIAMELVAGRTLADLTPRDGLPLAQVLRYGVQAADALAKAHAAGIIHRDLKPGNIMVTGDGLVKVLDFGLAKLTQATPAYAGGSVDGTAAATLAPKTEQGHIVGTVSYMSPEQAEGRAVDARSDVFSFGAVLYEMVTGRRAFQGDTPISTLSAVLRDEPGSVSDLRLGTPTELARVIKRALRKDPARRFQTMADLKVALEELKEESDSGTLTAMSPAAATAVRKRGISPLSAAAAGAAVVGLVAGGAWMLTRAASAPPAASVERMSRAEPLTNYRGEETNPSFSPDGTQMVFEWNGEKQDNWDIYLKVVGAGAPLRLTTDPEPDFGPQWSPDGRTIAFVRRKVLNPSQEAPRSEDQLILMPALGGSERILARFAPTRNAQLLAWSHDGKSIVFGGGVGAKEGLHLVALETGEMRDLTHPTPGEADSAPAFSPDGRSIAMTRSKGMQISELRILALSDTLEPQGEPRILKTEGLFPRAPVWTIDGREILYAAGLDARSNIYRVSVDGSAPARILEAAGDGADGPVISPKGNQLVFERFSRSSSIWRLDTQNRASAPESLIGSTARDVFPQYSPDGKRIVFYSTRSGTNQIWECDADGSRPVQVTNMTGTITGTPRWSPDGQKISFDSNTGGQWRIYTMDATGGKPQPVTSAAMPAFASSWSRDGKWIYFGSNKNGQDEVWKVPSGGGDAVQVTRNGGNTAVESPDGSMVYFVKTRGQVSTLWKMPAGGGAETQIAPAVFRYNFVVVDDGVYYATPTKADRQADIEFLDFKSGKVTALGTLSKAVDLGLTVSPDRRYVLFTQSEFMGGDLMMIDKFR